MTTRECRPRATVSRSSSASSSNHASRPSIRVSRARTVTSAPAGVGARWVISTRLPTLASPGSRRPSSARIAACSKSPTSAGVASTSRPSFPYRSAVRFSSTRATTTPSLPIALSSTGICSTSILVRPAKDRPGLSQPRSQQTDVDLRGRDPAVGAQRRGEPGSLARREARRDLLRRLVDAVVGRDAPAGHEQLLRPLRHQAAVRDLKRVAVPHPVAGQGDRIVEGGPLIPPPEDVPSLEPARLVDAELPREILEIRVLEPLDLLQLVDDRHHATAAFDLRPGQVVGRGRVDLPVDDVGDTPRHQRPPGAEGLEEPPAER